MSNETVTINGQPFCCNVVGGIQPNGVIGIVSLGACGVVPPPPNPATLHVSNVSYNTPATPALRPNVSLVEWLALWGFSTADPHEVPAAVWPGKGGSGPVLRSMTSTDIVVLHFKTPPQATMPKSGTLTGPRSWGINSVDLCIAHTAYDAGTFANPVTPGGLQLGKLTADSQLMAWVRNDQALNSTKCSLAPDTDYFLGLRISPAEAQPRRPVALLVQSNFGSP